MSELLPPVDDSFLRANEAIAALKKTRPRNVTEARNRAVELSRLNDILSKAARNVAETQAQARVVNGNGAQPVQGEAAALSDELMAALARSTGSFVKATIADAVRPLKERIAKLEPRLKHGGTWKAEWICEQPNTDDNGLLSCGECGSCGPRMRSGPILLNAVWLSIAKRPEEFLCSACVQERCRERLGRELSGNDLRSCDANRSWLAIRRTYHDK